MGAAVLAAALTVSGVLHTASVPERTFLACVQEHESHGNPKAENPTSTSSGLHQMIDSTWRGNARWAKWGHTYPARHYTHASHAPASIQILVALHSLRHGGAKAWHGTGCKWRGRVV